MAANTVETAIATAQIHRAGNRVPAVGCRGENQGYEPDVRGRLCFPLTVSDGKVTHIREYIDTLALARASEWLLPTLAEGARRPAHTPWCATNRTRATNNACGATDRTIQLKASPRLFKR
jgi:hypothetical protein